MKPKLKKIDLTKGNHSNRHPDINHKASHKQYLAKINEQWMAGFFIMSGKVLNFSCGWQAYQYDKPGTNASCWQELYEIIDDPVLASRVVENMHLAGRLPPVPPTRREDDQADGLN
jgi:hypothetical protein